MAGGGPCGRRAVAGCGRVGYQIRGAAFRRLPWLPQMCCHNMQDHRAKACNTSCIFLKAGLPKEEVKKERMGSQIQWRLPVFASTTTRSSHILILSNDLSVTGCKHWRQYLASRCTSTTRECSDRWIETVGAECGPDTNQ
jgi:hypothetical protein